MTKQIFNPHKYLLGTLCQTLSNAIHCLPTFRRHLKHFNFSFY